MPEATTSELITPSANEPADSGYVQSTATQKRYQPDPGAGISADYIDDENVIQDVEEFLRGNRGTLSQAERRVPLENVLAFLGSKRHRLIADQIDWRLLTQFPDVSQITQNAIAAHNATVPSSLTQVLATFQPGMFHSATLQPVTVEVASLQAPLQSAVAKISEVLRVYGSQISEIANANVAAAFPIQWGQAWLTQGAAPLETTNEAQLVLTDFRRSVINAIYSKVRELLGSNLSSAQVALWSDPEDENPPLLALTVVTNATDKAVAEVRTQVLARISEMAQTWSEAERQDYMDMIAFHLFISGQHATA